MKQYDKNSLIGFLLMGLIIIVFNTFFFPQIEVKNESSTQVELAKEEETYKTPEKEQTITYKENEKEKELTEKYGSLGEKATGKKEYYTLENEKIKITLCNKGGRIINVLLKDYQTYNSVPLQLFDEDSSLFNLQFTTGKSINTKDLYFSADESSGSISMKLQVSESKYIEFIYILSDDYMIDFDINIVGMNDIIPPNINYMNLEWQMKTPHTEKSKSNQDSYTGIYYQYQIDREVDNLSLVKSEKEDINAKLSWVCFKQQFFSSILISEQGFEKPTSLSSVKEEGSAYIKNLYAKFEIPYSHKDNEQLDFQFYFGPNNFKKLKSYNMSLEETIPLGFIWIDTLVNKYIIINLFDFLSKYISNYGLIILILTIIIKLALSPFTYKAYLSQAKMKVLKPEIDKINEKNKQKDPLKVQQETMNVYRKAGVNPMGGCLPMLFQFPILIAMFRFFPASIELRQKSFLWADDLSTYDSILELGFSIPFYGDHVSLFTLLMTISTILYTRMNASMTTGQMAQMKWMMYLMPIMFLGFFNNYAAGLSYYYFLANMFTFGQQYFMKKLINEDQILSQLEANKKKPRKKSKFQKKLEELQKKQEQKLKNRRK